jgi:UPF0176 protein
VPDVATTKDFVKVLDSGAFDHLKNRPVVTYCTGGVRCEVLSAVMKNRGFNEVYQIEGGIVRYAEEYRANGLWEGSLYVFDRRMKVDFTDVPTAVGVCECCGSSASALKNCSNQQCRKLTVMCEMCQASDMRCPLCTA